MTSPWMTTQMRKPKPHRVAVQQGRLARHHHLWEVPRLWPRPERKIDRDWLTVSGYRGSGPPESGLEDKARLHFISKHSTGFTVSPQ